MNTITHAFKASGVKLPPLKKRIWLWVNDHPGKTSKEVANALAIDRSTTASQLGFMVKRKMMTSTQEKHPFRNQMLTRYSTCIKEYELPPMPRAKATPFSPQIPLPLVEQPKPAVMLPPVPKPVMSVLEGYTLRELRQIRDALNKLFEFV